MPDFLTQPSLLSGRNVGNRHITSLDGVRGLAILLVVTLHLLDAEDHGMGSAVRAIIAMTKVGWMGVDLFFVLSGFLITGILFDTADSSNYFRNFYARRTLRIFPLYYGILIAALAFKSVLAGVQGLDQVATNQIWYWTYTSNIPSLWTGDFMPGFGHFWSLAVEEQFYLFWPFAIFLSGRKNVVKLCVACIAAAPLARCGLLLLQGTSGADAIYALMPCRVDALAFGALGAAVVRQWSEAFLRKAVQRTALVSGISWVAVVITAKGVAFSHPIWQTVGYSVNAALAASLITFLALERQNTFLGNVFRNKGLRFFGKYSYGLYIWHLLVLELLRHYFPATILMQRLHSRVLGGGLYSLLVMGISIVMALASWHLYEQHFLLLKAYFTSTKAIPKQRPLVPEIVFALPEEVVVEFAITSRIPASSVRCQGPL